MYCKFCGNKIAPGTTKCPACGARINLADGGISFYTEEELSAWGTPQMPQTVMLETQEVANRKRKSSQNAHSSGRSISYSSGGRGRKIKSRGISSSNRIIAFCVASTLVIILLVVAIAIALKPVDPVEDETYPTQTPYTSDDNGNNTITTTPAPTAETAATPTPKMPEKGGEQKEAPKATKKPADKPKKTAEPQQQPVQEQPPAQQPVQQQQPANYDPPVQQPAQQQPPAQQPAQQPPVEPITVEDSGH